MTEETKSQEQEAQEPQETAEDKERAALLTRLTAAADKFARKRQMSFTKDITKLVAILGKHQSAHLTQITNEEKGQLEGMKKLYEDTMKKLSEKYQHGSKRAKDDYARQKMEINTKFKGQYTDHENQLKAHQTDLSDSIADFQEQAKELSVEQLTKLLAEGQVHVADDPRNHKLIRTPEKLQEIKEADEKRHDENTGAASEGAAQSESVGEPGNVEGGVPAQE